MHPDHDIFTRAIQEKKKVKLTFYGSERSIKERFFGPIYYSASSREDDSDYYYLWDFETETNNDFTGLSSSQIVNMKLSDEPFDFVEFFTSKREIEAEKTWSQVDRRSGKERRSSIDRRCSTAPYDGPERRSRKDRRCLPERRSNIDKKKSS
jgi:hypothetical protein